MTSKTIVITGASSGIGAAAARTLAGHGHRVVVVGRDPVRTAAVAVEIGAEHHVADFARLDEVRALAATLAQRLPRIDVLANNAGGISGEHRRLTPDGHEWTFQVNHLAPFLLTNLLMDTLVASSATVLATSSMASRGARLDLGDLDMAHRYAPFRAYGASKLANVLFVRELHRRFHGQGVSSAAFHPGIVATNFGAIGGPRLLRLYGTALARAVFTQPYRGADQLVRFAEGTPGTDWTSGQYWVRGRVGRTGPQADDPGTGRRLWEVSAEMVGLA